MLGLKVAEPGCDPNLLVIVVADGRKTVSRLIQRRTANFRSQALSDVRRIVAEPGSARAWVEIETRSRDGDRPVNDPDAPPLLTVQGSSRIANGFRRDIVSAIVVIDAAAAAGRDAAQIADYAAMRGLSDARPDRMSGAASILDEFTPKRDTDAPRALTPLDRGILRGLYSGQGNVPSALKQGMMVQEVLAETQGRRSGADEQ